MDYMKQITMEQAEKMVDIIFKNKKLLKQALDILQIWKQNGFIKDTENEKTVIITVDLDDDIFKALALEAHKLDMTFNEYINMVLRNFFDKYDDGK